MIQSKTYQSANYGYFTLQEDFTMGGNPKKKLTYICCYKYVIYFKN